MINETDRIRLQHMLDAARKIQIFTKGVRGQETV